MATALNSIGSIYLNTEKYDKAIESFTRSAQMLEEVDKGEPSVALAVDYADIGNTYSKKKNMIRLENMQEGP